MRISYSNKFGVKYKGKKYAAIAIKEGGDMHKTNQKIATVKVAGKPIDIVVPITSSDKPSIPDDLIAKWQHILDVAAKIIGVPAGLIMQLHEREIEVFLASQTTDNPYHQHETAELQTGLYCETVVGTRQELLVSNALTEPPWEHNPDVKLQMISYFGVPIRWRDGEVFGTICVLDRKEHPYSPVYRELVYHFCDMIETDLQTLLTYQQLQQHAIVKELQLREIHHRVKNHFNLLLSSLNLHSVYSSPGNTLEGILVDIRSRISAIALIHDKLYQSKDIEQISLREYLQDLGKQIISNCTHYRVAYHCEGDEIIVSPKVSVPCGLLVSEWISNSLKYAFTTTETPEIKVKIVRLSSGEVTLSYHDNGIGLPEPFDIEQTNSLGMILIRHLTTQLSGTLSMRNDHGLHYHITFNPEHYKK